MKNIWKRWTSGFLVLAILLSFLPVWPQTAAAATGFFYPDDPELAKTANPASSVMSRSAAYLSENKLLTIKGTFSAVSSDSLKVKVEQMINKGSNVWEPDTTRTSTKSITSAGNRFEAPNVQLFAGYNKITLLGTQNGSEKSDVFYVLYEDVPYLSSLKVGAGSDEPFELSEGAARIVKKPATTDPNYKMMIYVQGVATNATKVVINGNQASPTEDGQFFAPPFQLKPGRNDLKIVLSNDSNTVEVTRTLYYYDENKPFIDVSLINGDGTNSVYNTTPILTDSSSSAALKVSMLVPYQSASISTATVTMDTYSTDLSRKGKELDIVNTPADKPDEVIIYGKTGLPEFKYVTFKAEDSATPYTLLNSTTDTPVQTFDLTLSYGSGSSTFKASTNSLSYKYYPGYINIKSIELLNGYDTTAKTYSSKVDLNQADVSDSEFYIGVTGDKDISAATLVLGAKLLPYNTTNLTVTLEKVNPGDKFAIYKVAGLPSGEQQVEFQYTDSGTSATMSPAFPVTVKFISKSYISVDDLYDGQVITVDSSTLPLAPISFSGSYINFTSMNKPQISVNGINLTQVLAKPISNGQFYVDSTNQTFEATVPFSGNPSVYYGENRITIQAKDTIGSTIQTITKEIRIYIVDKNVPNILTFKPLEIPSDKIRPTLDETVFSLPYKQIRTPEANKYYTKLKEVDLGIQGSGADYVAVYKAGVLLVEIQTSNGATSKPASGVTYDQSASSWSGNRNNFNIRLKGLSVPETGSHVFTVEFRNTTGVRVTQRLEIVREVADVVVWSPVATVGDRIVVNKNFVWFDIEAEGADSVTVDGNAATPRSDIANRYTYNFIGLKQDKEQTIKIVVDRAGTKKTETVKVLFTGAVDTGSQYMEEMSTKHTVFGGGVNLTFPKGTVLKTANPQLTIAKTPKFYDSNNLLFGIASPTDGVVERVNDYGQIKGTQADSRTYKEQTPIYIDNWLSDLFTNSSERARFTTISPIYWISGGLGESKGLGNDKPSVDGQVPYSVEGTFTKYAAERKIIPTNRGQLTLKFDQNVVDAVGTTVTVFYFNDQGEWKNLGGEVDTKKNTITVPFDDFGYFMVAKLKEGYADITNHPWARNILDALFAKGMMDEARYDEFGTDDYITRGEFTTLLVRALNIPLNYDSNNTFFDVFDGASALWKYPEIETAARMGIVTGMENRYFGVNQRITRGQAATMIARAMDGLKLPLNDAKLVAALQKTFTDAAAMTESYYYALPAISAINKEGIMVGMPNEMIEGQKKQTVRFDAAANMTRAQAGAIMVRLLKSETNIFPKNFDETEK